MTGFLVFLTISTALFSIFALGLNLQWGFTGLINFGHVAFMTIGAYTTVLLSSQGVPIIIAVIIGAGLAALLGLLIGTATLRLREDYLSIVTIGVSELLRLIALNEEQITKGAFGVSRFPIPLEKLPNNPITQILTIGTLTLLAIFAVWQLWRNTNRQLSQVKQIQNKSYRPQGKVGSIAWGIIAFILIMVVYINGAIALMDGNYKARLMVLVLLVLALVYSALELLVHSPWGRVLKAIREDEEIPRALGKNVFWYKLQALMLGGAIAGIAGAFYAWQLTTVYPTNFEPIVTFNAWTIVMLGGTGNNAGTILGAVLVTAYETITRFKSLIPFLAAIDDRVLESSRGMLIGLVLMLLMMWRPQGILGKKEELTLGK
ncbi:MAG: branched-chain amino acid ABC transporter permease [Xenococcaceae cyanobacterium]